MLTYLRYALATSCFAASVGCLALWGLSYNTHVVLSGPRYIVPAGGLYLTAHQGKAIVGFWTDEPSRREWSLVSDSVINYPIPKWLQSYFGQRVYPRGRGVYFPLWYPALIFALAGVAALRLGHRFTIRSAIIATTVLAGLLGMAVEM